MIAVWSNLGARDYSRAWNFVLKYRNPPPGIWAQGQGRGRERRPNYHRRAWNFVLEYRSLGGNMSSQYRRRAWNFIS